MPETVALWGGVFAVLAFIHFAVDWCLQTHAQGHSKSFQKGGRGPLVLHCLVYTLGFAPILAYLASTPWEGAAALAILFLSHLVGDTYLPVYLWFRYVRRPPLPRNTEEWSFVTAYKMCTEDSGNLILVTVVDQVWHLAWLWPVVWLVVRNV